MSRCLDLASKGSGQVSPNPMVGSVIVKNNRILAEGYHHHLGGAHAEIEALQKIKFKAQGTTLYCNLEPCCHVGRTPPCVHRIIESGIKKVVVAHRDPNPLVAGKSIRLLRKAGIEVVEDVLKEEALFLNRIFITWITKKRPYVVLKMALSQDGKIGFSKKTKKRKVFWITGKQARKEAHVLRSKLDAILVGVNTVLCDNPKLTVRGVKRNRQPARFVLDSHLRTPLCSQIFRKNRGAVFLGALKSSKKRGSLYEKKGASVWFFPGSTKIPLKDLLGCMATHEISSLLVEGGPIVWQSFLKNGLCDEMVLYVSPKILGPDAISAMKSWKEIRDRWRVVGFRRLGVDKKFILMKKKVGKNVYRYY